MDNSSWEIIINKCPHCHSDLNIHYHSTVSEKHLMEMVYKDINFHLGNECLDSVVPKISTIEMETEKISPSSSARLYQTKMVKLVF